MCAATYQDTETASFNSPALKIVSHHALELPSPLLTNDSEYVSIVSVTPQNTIPQLCTRD